MTNQRVATLMQATKPALIGLLTLALITSGCIGADSVIPTESGNDTNASDANTTVVSEDGDARLIVEVIDLAIRPVENANVTVDTSEGTRTLLTGAAGTAEAEELAPGIAIISVEAPGYEDRQVQTELEPGDTTRQSITLRPLDENGTFVDRYEFEGFFECSATYLIVTGDCFALVNAVAPVNSSATNHRFTFHFEANEGWSEIRINQTWEEPTFATGSTMRINLEAVDPNNETEGHGAPHYARAQGSESPLNLTVYPGEVHPTAENENLSLPEEGAPFRTRTFHLGFDETQNPGGTAFLGAGVAFQQEFTVTVEIVYG